MTADHMNAHLHGDGTTCYILPCLELYARLAADYDKHPAVSCGYPGCTRHKTQKPQSEQPE